MTKDLNKGIDSIYYNHLNLPIKVEFATVGDSITYLYDAAGIKLNQVVFKAGDTLKVTDYVGEFIYENDSLEIIQHEEGRIVPKYSVDGSSIEFYDYQYHLKDHLGNVRVTFSTTPESYTIVETFETGEENGWQDLHRHVLDTANTTIGGDEVELLQSGQTGAMVFLSVNKRDTLNLSVNANYEIAPSNNNFLSTAYNALFTSFDNIYGSGAEAGVSSSSTTFNDALSGTDMGGKNDASTAPRAFINYIFFDKEMSYVSAGFTQITTAALGIGVHENVVMPEFVADREGYVLAYLSNENQEAISVHFDDFTVYHGKTNVVSTQDYYPFGLTFNESQRTASTKNNFLYNGKEYEAEMDWYNYGARMLDPTIGRWNGIDQYSFFYKDMTPYNYAINNPVNVIDPDGRLVIFVNGFNDRRLISSGLGWYNPDRDFHSESPITDFDYWKGFDNVMMDGLHDDNALYVNGHHRAGSGAASRYSSGKLAAETLIKKLESKEVTLSEGETIKIIGHSQGAAFAAGLASVLASNDKYSHLLEYVFYIAPHQPTDFDHPNDIIGYQFSREGDRISSEQSLYSAGNGGSKLGIIPGLQEENYLVQAENNDDGRGGHSVSTFENLMTDFLNSLEFQLGTDINNND